MDENDLQRLFALEPEPDPGPCKCKHLREVSSPEPAVYRQWRCIDCGGRVVAAVSYRTRRESR